MYLDGQLPGGPPSSNKGGNVTPDGMSALYGSRDMGPQSDMPPDLSGSTFWVVPNAGPVVVSPSLATVDGVVQYPQSPMTLVRRGDNPVTRNSPAGWAAGNPSEWEAANWDSGNPLTRRAGLAGLGAVDPVTCTKIQCGAIPQSVAGLPLIVECANAGYAGVRSCLDPSCSPSCPSQLITPGPAAPLVPLLSPAPPNAYVPRRSFSVCPGYGADGSLISLRNDVFAPLGTSEAAVAAVASPDSAWPWWLLGLAGLALLASNDEGGKRR